MVKIGYLMAKVKEKIFHNHEILYDYYPVSYTHLIERDTALSKEEIYRKIDVLRNACDTGDDLIAKEALRSVVPTFKTPEEVNKEIA